MITIEPLPWACGDIDGVVAFNTLRGQAAPGDPYSQYNLCDYRTDRADHVKASQSALCNLLGIGPDRLVWATQTHSTNVAIVDPELLAMSNSERHEVLTGIDALVTAQHGVCIGIHTADCVNLAMVDPQAGVVAVAHGGWKGTANRIAAATVQTMRQLGADPTRIMATMGASICTECFEVGDEVVDAFAREHFDISRIMRRNTATGKAHISLRTATTITLTEAGVPEANIVNTHRCTRCAPNRYFSARILGIDSGRVFTGIMMR